MPEPNDLTPPVTRDRILSILEDLGISPMLDGEGDLAISLFPYLFYIVTQNQHPILGIGAAPRSVDMQYTELASEFVASHNADFYAPKMYSMVSDEGKIRFRLSHCFNWDAGATDEQISSEIDAFLRGSMDAFGRMEAAFPDPWALGDES